MLSQLKSYLFGGSSAGAIEEPKEADCAVGSPEDDWVLVDTQEVIGDCDDEGTTNLNLEESWIVTQELLKSRTPGSAGRGSKNRQRHQPKGTKMRRWKASSSRKPSSPSPSSTSNNSIKPKPVQSLLEDTESNSSSIAIVPSPEPLTRPVPTPVAASTVLAASSDAKQLAVISSARAAKLKTDKCWMSRKNLLRGNQTMMAASGRNNRRSQLIGSRLCGSNNNRKSHQY